MKHLIKPILTTAILATLVSACATQPMLSDSEAVAKYKSVGALEQSIKNVDSSMLSLLSQDTFKRAQKAAVESKALAIKDSDKAISLAKSGASLLEKAQINADKAQDIFSEVLDARSKALTNGALTQSPKKFAELEVDFKKMTRDFEEGKVEKATLQRAKMIESYQNLELKSLKLATVDDAKKYISKAKDADADKYAKKTYKMAKEELALALSMLDADKSNKAKADKHAAQAIFLSEKSISITNTIKEFNANDYSPEEIVLWHQDQLAKSVKPLNMELPLNLSSKNLTESVSTSINDVIKNNKAVTNQRDELKVELMKRDDRINAVLTAKQVELQQLEARDAQEREKLTFIQGLFNNDEAKVYREKDNILVRAQGFYFASGQSEIDSRNFSILKKIGSAIAQYPNSKIVVTGHTDANGNDENNLALSTERANKVMKFLNEVGGISSDRLTAEGFGEQKPVATNETIEGRTENRRVEILIIN